MPSKKTAALEVPVKEWLPILALMEGFTAERDILPALKYLYFSKDNIRAYSGDAGASWSTPWAMPEGEFAIPGEALLKIISSLREQGHETVSIEVIERSLLLRAAGFKGTLNILKDLGDAKETFMFRASPPTKAWTPLTPGFWSDVGRVAFTVCKDATKPILQGVFWAQGGSLVTSDGYRATLCSPEAKTKVAAPIAGGLLIPDRVLGRLKGRQNEVAAIALERESLLWCQFDAGTIYANLIEGTFPLASFAGLFKQYREQLVAKNGTLVQLPDAGPMDMVMTRLLLFADGPTYRVQVEVEDKTATLTVCDAEGHPAAEERLPVAQTGPPCKFAIHGRYLREALAQVSTTFWFSPETSARVFFESADKRVKHLVQLLV